MKPTAEQQRLNEAKIGRQDWKRWGPYLSERQWGTVREDYSPHGNAWEYLPHDHARSRAYRWGEDGIAGISDDQQRLCLSLALWNGKDPILKERLFGLTNSEGNHGEDVKELYYYLDATLPLKVRSLVGLIPLFAVEVLESSLLDEAPQFKERLEWFLNYRPDLARLVSRWDEPGMKQRHLLSLLRGHRMKCLRRRMLDETEFLSEFGVRAISRHHLEHPYEFHTNGNTMSVGYQPAESNSGLFGGNSNWRGPIWMPVNYLLIESLQKFHHYYGDDFKVECPTGSGHFMTLNEVADELSRRLATLFLKGEDGQRPVLKYHSKLASDPHFKDYVLFHEYFHGDNGRGVGASHQTGWTGLVAKLMQPRGDKPGIEKEPKGDPRRRPHQLAVV
jgi:hypothetical protein